MDALSVRMQAFVKDELEKLGASQSFLQEKVQAFKASEQEVNEQTAQSRDDLNEVLGEIKMLREEVKQKVGTGLNELSAAAEKISANIITELDAFHTELHSSYSSLGKEFKSTFDDLVKNLNEQQAENERLQQQVLDANTALVRANKASQAQLTKIIDEENQKGAEERQQLLAQITSLITASAENQVNRLNEKVSLVSEGLTTANETMETEQSAYSEGMKSWSSKSQDILAGVAKSRDAVKTKIKSDFAVSHMLHVQGITLMVTAQAATQHSTSIKDTTTSVHANTVQIVEAQMEQMDTQLHSLDDIMTRVREQNDAHHAAHMSSLGALSSTVQSSYSSIGDHLSTSFDRVQSLETDMSAQTATLKETLPTLGEDSIIRAPLQELRGAIGAQNLLEYNPTGETPQRVNYVVPEKLPRTEAAESLLSRLRDRPVTADALLRSPTKSRIYNDATQSLSNSEDLFNNVSKPNLSRSMSVNTPLAPLGELDVNVLAQENHTQPLPIVSNSDSMVIAAPPPKKQRGEDSKLPMKKMGRKTVGGEGKGDRENLTITSFASSVGPGLAGGRRLRSHGSNGSS